MPSGCEVPPRSAVLDELHSGMSHSAIGHEFYVNELTIYMNMYINGLNKVPLNRSTQQRSHIDPLVETM